MDGVQFGSDAALNYSTQMSPTLSSYDNLSGNELIGLAGLQSSYQPQPSSANLQAADKYVEAAAQATDPNLQQQLLQQAIAELQRGGAPAPNVAPSGVAPSGGTGVSAPASGGASALSGAGTSTSVPDSLSVNGNSVNTGEYTISASSKDDGSLTITNNQTGQSTEVWGDPHIKVNGQDVADFQKDPLNIQLQDGTVVHIDPTALQNGVAHIGQVSITKGDQSVTMGGTGQNGSFAGGVNTSAVSNGTANFQSALYNAPDATNITLGADGNLYSNNANGSMGQEITAQSGGGETDLDGTGGGLVGQPSTQGGSGASGSSPANLQQTIEQLMGLLANSSESFYGIMMQQTLSSMMSHSGYAQN